MRIHFKLMQNQNKAEQALVDLLPTQALVKRTFIVGEEDYMLVKSVFPERGTLTYMPGIAYSVLANLIRTNNINSYAERVQDKRFASVAGVLSSLRFDIDSAE